MDRTVADFAPIEGIRLSRPRDGVALLTIDRPEYYNALDEPVLLGLPGVFDGLADDPGIRSVVICGAGPAFCAGGDLDLIRKVAGAPFEEGEEFLARAMRSAVALRRLAKPTIAAIDGPVAGAGLGLALACDMRLAGPTSTFCAPFIHMGLVPDMGLTWLLPRAVGFGVAVELLLSGRLVGANEALTLGLVTRICDDPLSSALAMAATFAAMPPAAVAATKRLLHGAPDHGLETAAATEARAQADAIYGAEFGDRYDTWRAAVKGAGA